MSTLITTTKVTGTLVAAACSLDVSVISLRSTDLSLSSASLPVLPVSERSERPTEALAVVAAKAQANAYAFTPAAAGAGAQRTKAAEGGANGGKAAIGTGQPIAQQQKKTQHGMWAFRGPEPWSDPA